MWLIYHVHWTLLNQQFISYINHIEISSSFLSVTCENPSHLDFLFILSVFFSLIWISKYYLLTIYRYKQVRIPLYYHVHQCWIFKFLKCSIQIVPQWTDAFPPFGSLYLPDNVAKRCSWANFLFISLSLFLPSPIAFICSFNWSLSTFVVSQFLFFISGIG